VQPADLRPVLHAQHPPDLVNDLLEGVNFHPPQRGQFSGAADTWAA
jgi:hypothetical protein